MGSSRMGRSWPRCINSTAHIIASFTLFNCFLLLIVINGSVKLEIVYALCIVERHVVVDVYFGHWDLVNNIGY